MAYLKYYSKQRSIHADSYAVKVDFATAQALAKDLFAHFDVPTIPVKLFTQGAPEFKRMRAIKSWYSSNRKEIVLHPAMLTPATIAHEVAHYVDHIRALRAHRSLKRWHHAGHASITANGINFLKTSRADIYTQRAQETMLTKTLNTIGINIAQTADQIVEKFYEGLPAKLACPCCKAHLPKMNFGVRVMQRDATGLPTVIRRQSYCKACR